MSDSDILDLIAEEYPEALKMDGFDDCIIGMCTRFGQEPVIAYDVQKVLAKLMQDGMDEEEAREYFEFNQIGAWFGDMTPAFIETYVASN